MRKIYIFFSPIIFLYDLILSKFSRGHRISNESYLLMRYLYKFSGGYFLYLISIFLNGRKSELPFSSKKTLYKHKIISENDSDNILKSVFNISIINQQIYGEKLKLVSENKIDIDYYKKKNLIRLDFNSQELVKNRLISYYATNPYWPKEIVNILGTKPCFVGIDAWLTLSPSLKMHNYDEIGKHVSSQMWHRDCDNLRDIKVMTYLTDVKNDENGPFEIVEGTDKLSFFNPTKYIMGSAMRVKDDYVQEKFKESIFTFIGDRGDSIIADTRALHRGKTVITKNFYRVMFQLYFSNHIFGKTKLLEPPSKEWESFDIWKEAFKRGDCFYESLFKR